MKHGKTGVTKSSLVLVLNLIDSEGGTSFLDQSLIDTIFLALQTRFFSLSDDHSRVHLSIVDGIVGSDYINANFCDVSVSSSKLTSEKTISPLNLGFLYLV